ncbi:hypothetical protein MTO96_013867 [Rhipicephalus appendiculatus]
MSRARSRRRRTKRAARAPWSSWIPIRVPLPPQHNKGCGSARHVKRFGSALRGRRTHRWAAIPPRATTLTRANRRKVSAVAAGRPKEDGPDGFATGRPLATNDTNQRTRFDELSRMTTRAPRCAAAGRRPRAEQYGHARRRLRRRHPVAI